MAGRKGRAAVLVIADGIERRRLTGSARSAAYTCSECPGKSFTKDQYVDHLKSHGSAYAVPAGLVIQKAAAQLTDTADAADADKPKPVAAPAKIPASELSAVPGPAAAPTWATADSETGTPVVTAVRAPQPGHRTARPVPTAATAAHTTHTNTAKRSTSAMTDVQQLVRAVDSLTEVVPANAEELDDFLTHMALAWLKIAESISGYAEMLDSDVRLDPRVTRSIYDGADSIAALGKSFRDARGQFRKVYEAEFEAMSSEARRVAVDGFWDNGA